jgi:cytochrome c peroxidase
MRWLILLLVPLPVFAQADFPPVEWMETEPARVELGRLLFYDPILSGNQGVACATCHAARFGTADGVSLGIGDGGIGLGPDRRIDPDNPPEQRVPRNSPGLFNLGASEFTVMFHDGRLEADPARPGGIRTPLGDNMVEGFASVLAAQAMFPVLSADEMAGHYSENAIAQAVRMGQLSLPGGAWDRITARVVEIPEYRDRFDTVLGAGAPVEFTDIANAIAEFVAFEWRADDSPFDRYLAGGALAPAAERGRALFYGTAGCSACHAGRFQTDFQFYAIAMPQIGPGKAARFEDNARDEGRMRVTGDPADAYAFRTPSLRNVTLTAPYGHSGAYATLEGVIRHHLDPVTALMAYDRSQAILPDLAGVSDWRILEDSAEMRAIADANMLVPMVLEDPQIADLIAFLEALTEPGSQDGRLGVPDIVPSGLPVGR